MTRQDQIKEMAQFHARCMTCDKDMRVAFADALRRGAEWADEHPDWISVEEELPKEDGIYLFYDEASGVYTSAYYVGFAFLGSITHWMPLPEPPKKESEK